jgi:RHS repeat-associated protein
VVVNNLRLPGQYYDQETKLKYNLHRYFDKDIGRYVTKDPIGQSSDINLYRYALSNPIKNYDPEGLFAPGHHYSLTRDVVVQTKCSKAIYLLPQMTMNVDLEPNSQDPENSHWHAMANGLINETPQEAEKKTNDYINEMVAKCNLDSIARALHAEQDKYSTSHAYKSWHGGFPGIFHMWQDTFGAFGKPLSNARMATKQLFYKALEKCPCICND